MGRGRKIRKRQFFEKFSIVGISNGLVKFAYLRLEGPKYPYNRIKVFLNFIITLEISRKLVSKNEPNFEKFPKNRQVLLFRP